MLPTQESLTVEFKSERKRPQNDSEIVGNIVALANTQGGSLYLGIEDDGTVTGVSQEHENTTGLESSIFNKTRPPMRTRTERIPVGDKTVVRIEVHASEQIVSTSDARTLQRRLKADGSPEVVPLYPEEFISRLSQQRQYDYSDQPAPTAEYSDPTPPRATNCAPTSVRPAWTAHCSVIATKTSTEHWNWSKRNRTARSRHPSPAC